MGNIAFQKASIRQNKTTYKGLSDKQKAYIKAKKSFEQADKELNRFWRTAPRTTNMAVNFDALSDEELDLFTHICKVKERALKKMNKLEEEIDVDYTLNVFRQINTHSASY